MYKTLYSCHRGINRYMYTNTTTYFLSQNPAFRVLWYGCKIKLYLLPFYDFKVNIKVKYETKNYHTTKKTALATPFLVYLMQETGDKPKFSLNLENIFVSKREALSINHRCFEIINSQGVHLKSNPQPQIITNPKLLNNNAETRTQEIILFNFITILFIRILVDILVFLN